MKITINSYSGMVHYIEGVDEVVVDDLDEPIRFLALLDEDGDRMFALPIHEIRAIHYLHEDGDD